MTDSTAEPIEPTPEDAAAPPNRRRRLLIGVGVATVLSVIAAAGITTTVVNAQQQQAAQAEAATAAAEEAEASALADARGDADIVAETAESVRVVLENADAELYAEQIAALKTIEVDARADSDSRDGLIEATYTGIRDLDRVLRGIVNDARATLGGVQLARDSDRTALEDALLALATSPRGLPSSYSSIDALVADVLDAAAVAAAAHNAAVIVAGPAAPGAPSNTTPGTNGGGTSSGGTTGGGSGGGSGGGAGTPAPPPPPPAHPRAALCESLGFGANGASCLANTPTYVTTNASYVPWGTCSTAGGGPGAYGTHTPGFGGTSRPSYTFPWSYQINYASSGLGTVQFYVCDM